MMAANLQSSLGLRPALSGPRRTSRPARQQSGVCRAAEQPEATTTTPLDVLRRDIQVLEAATGLDLHTPLGNLAQAHDEMVAVLNPLAGGKMQRELEEQIAGLQQQLAIAHQQVHSTEQRVEDTLRDLTELEDSLRRAWAAPAAPAAAAATAAPVAAPPAQPATQQQQAPQRAAQRGEAASGPRRRGLQNGLALEPELRNFWYPCEFSSRLGAGEMATLELFETSWVLFRDESGATGCIKDECAHRACPLSLGKLVDGQPQCPYHGWQYDRTGACTKMPSTTFCKGIAVTALPVVEQDGLIWVWPGDKEAVSGGPPAVCQPPEGFQVHAELVMDVPVEHGLLLENLLDLAHAPFTHTSTFAKGWPVPDVVRFHAGKMLGGHWEPYPIDMEFGPPCLVLSTIGLAQPGKIERGARAAACSNHLHQLHVCLPSTPGRTKLLYRMSLDFMHWTKHVPGIQQFWKNIAAQVLGEDLVLVAGQQDRLQRGGDVWKNPVPFDKLGVRYRRWRNAVASGDEPWRRQAESGLRQLSAGELFDHSSDEDGLSS